MAVQRIEGLDKVLGRKVYARDLRARDVEGWPDTTTHALLLRVTHADRPFLGIDEGEWPDALRPTKMVTARNLDDDQVRGVFTFGRNWLVEEGRLPERLGQPVAIVYYDSPITLADASVWLRKSDTLIRYGTPRSDGIEQDVRRLIDPLLGSIEREAAFEYGAVHFVRLAGAGGSGSGGEDNFSHVHDGSHDPTAVGPDVEDFRRVRNRAARDAAQRIEREIAENGYRIVDRTISTQITDTMFMEPQAGLAWRQGGILHLVIATQSPTKDIDDIERMFGDTQCPFHDLRVELDARHPGGAFGGRDASSFPLLLSLCAVYADGPVRLAYDRNEQFLAGIKRHASAVRTRLAIDDDGTMQALQSATVLDGGGEPNLSRPVMGLAALHAAGPYRIPRAVLSAKAVHTDSAPAGSMRGFGIPQVAFGVETVVDEAAHLAGEDPIAYRSRHVLARGDKDVTGMALEHHIANDKLCELAAAESLWTERDTQKAERDGPGVAYGVGFACCMEAYGTTRDGVLAEVEVTPDGSITVRSPAVDFGQGAATALAIATEPSLGANATAVHLGQHAVFDALQLEAGGRDRSDDPRWTPKLVNSMSASMTVFHHVHAVEEACRIVLEHGFRPAAAAIWGADASDARWEDGALRTPGLDPLDLESLAERAHADGLVTSAMVHTYFQNVHATAELTIDGTTVRRAIDALAVRRGGGDRQRIDRQAVEYPSREARRFRRSLYASIGHLVAVEVRLRTGAVQVTDVVTVLDAGEVHHEALLRGQVDGGFAMGLGFAMLEELPPAPEGANYGWNLHRYQLPRARHMPIDSMKLVLVPLDGDLLAGGSTHRKKGIAEAAMSTVAPAVANAVAHATGARVNALPMTPKRVLEALRTS